MTERETRLPAWMTYRPEGYPVSHTLKYPWRIAWYTRKYRKKNYLATRAQLEHFNRQRRLLASLRRTKIYDVPADRAVKLATVGDLMWVRTNWHGFVTRDLVAYLAGFDALLGNLESPIDFRKPPVEWFKVDSATFNSDPRLLTSFYDDSRRRNLFTAVSFANNHTFDQGDDGALETIRLLERLSIQQSGLRRNEQDKPYVVFERNGIRFGMYAACYGYNNPSYVSGLWLNTIPGLAPSPTSLRQIDLSQVERVIRGMDREGVEFKIIYIHWGHEFELYPTPVQQDLGRRLAALGFDVIAGSHPHVLQPSEVCLINGYDRLLADKLRGKIAVSDFKLGTVMRGAGSFPRKSIIHYSLGNFTTAMLFAEPKYGVIQGLEVFRNDETGGVDWQLPDFRMVCNLLTVDNHGKKELVLLRPYFLNNRRRVERWYPRNRAAAGYLYRHLIDQMTYEELERGPSQSDYARTVDLLEEIGVVGL